MFLPVWKYGMYKQNRTWSKLFWKDPKFAIWIKIILKKVKVKCVLFCFQVCCPSYTFCCNDGQKCCHNNHNPLGQIFTTLKEAPFKVLSVKEIAKPIRGIIDYGFRQYLGRVYSNVIF